MSRRRSPPWREAGAHCAPPGFQGGTNWPGGCYDPETHKVFVFSETTVEPGSIVPGDPKLTEFAYVRGTPGTAQTASMAMGAVGAPVGTSGLKEGAAAADGFHPGQITIDGLPLLKPPYGTISAIGLENGTLDWQIAHGDTPDNIKNHPRAEGAEDSAHRAARPAGADGHQDAGDLRRGRFRHHAVRGTRRHAARL